MATVDVNGSAAPGDKAALEQQYMHLLEIRIAQLESLVKTADEKVKPAVAGATGADGEAHPKGDEKKEKAEPEARDVSDDKEKEKEKSAVDGAAEKEKDKEGETDQESTKKDDKPPARVRHFIAKFNDDTYEFDDEDATTAQGAKEADESSEDAEDDKDDEDDEDELDPVVFRAYMDEIEGKRVTSEEIEISTPELKRIFYDITGTEPPASDEVKSGEHSSSDATTLTLSSPFKEFIWHWSRFETACEASSDDDEKMAQARKDLKQLLVLIRESQAEACLKARETSLPKGNIPADYLWTIFSPGTLVRAKTFLNDDQILEVRTCGAPSGKYKWGDAGDMRVHCMGFDWDGTKFSTFTYKFDINLKEELEKKEKGTQLNAPEGIQINGLDVYPLKFHKDDDELRKKLINRGRAFWTMCKPGNFQFYYSGVLMATKVNQFSKAQMLARASDGGRDDDTMSILSGMDDSGNSNSSKKEYTGQIIVDAYSFLRTQDDVSDGGPTLGVLDTGLYIEGGCQCKACNKSPLVSWERLQKQQRRLSEAELYDLFGKGDDAQERFLMCPPRVLGYALKGKTWSQFRLLDCKELHKDIQERKSYFKDQLQLDKAYKDMLMAFVNSHQPSRSSEGTGQKGSESAVPRSLDVIEGKGKGIAILLHGPPGVGKTLTVETIALATGRPLLVVSVAEIGTKAAEAESRLNIFFAMAARWGAIMLIDEADVFLEKRVKTDNPERNMLVSVLLRSLEYYEGIVFLTTNRIRSIDVAVQSRMLLAIQYKSLNPRQAYAIYKNLLDKLKGGIIKGDREELYEKIKETLCDPNKVNGRQIRNIVTAALALAREEARGSNGDQGEIELRWEHLKKVHRTTMEFLVSLEDTTNKARLLNEAAVSADADGY